MSVLIVDYGMSNLGSVLRSFEECGASAFVSEDPADCRHAERIVLPGVGSFADGMAALNAGGWPEALRRAAQEEIPLLGICLGMHLLADLGYEGGPTQGLGLVPGEVRRLEPDTPETRIPHVGWNEVRHDGGHPLLSGIASGVDFYFVHSYHFVPGEGTSVLATTPYCGSFASVVGRGGIFGAQFHPEKSSRCGFQLIRNFLAY